MKLKKIEIHNYKTIKRLSVDFFNDITLIVGKNNIGKSNVLKAIELLFLWLEKKDLSNHLDSQDFRKNSTQIIISANFVEVDILIENLKNYLIKESSKSRPNQDTIKYYENLYRSFQLLENKFHELCIKLIIPRNEDVANLEIIKSTASSKINKYLELINKRNIADKKFHEILKQKQQEDSKGWFEYKWLKILKENDSYFAIYENQKIDITSEYINKINYNSFDKNVIEYIKLTQKFFYVPAYRGGKSERDEAINKLFDIIIEDLVHSKRGNSKDYDTVTDAIWGTGKNSNIYNLQSVIGNRLKSLTEDLKNDSISSIKEIEFQPYSNEDIRKQILKIMLGNTNIFLNDGIKTSFETKGTGIQSSFMITLMKALSKIEFEDNVSIILVIEEPEAFAHPQLIREIIDKISQEFKNQLFQFIVSTHSPVIVNFVQSNRAQRLHFNDTTQSTTNITNLKNINLCEEDWNLIDRVGDVNLSEIVFSDLVIFVEGEGDKIVFEKLLKIILPDFYSKISIISLSGNNQIYKLLKLLEYYNINWLMLFDKDSFVNKGDKSLDLQFESDLQKFFEDYQIGTEFQDNFRNVLKNQNVSKIKIAVQSNTKIGETLSKLNEVYFADNVNDLRQNLYSIISNKLDETSFPELDAIEIAKNLNDEFFNHNIPFYSLSSDLEGFVINEKTKTSVEEVYKKYYENSYNDFQKRLKNSSEQEYIHELKKVFGSKTHKLEKSSSDKKKPHIPIEIINNHLQKIYDNDILKYRDAIYDSFKELKSFTDYIVKRLTK